MSRKHTIFTPVKGPKTSFINELYFPFYQDTISNNFPELDELQALLTNSSLKRLYDLTIESLQCNNYVDSVFYADKLLTLCSNNKALVYLAGQCSFENGDYKKVYTLFLKNRVLNTNINYQILAARATYLSKQYELCVSVLDMTLENNFYSKKLEGSKYLIRAKCCEARESKQAAVHMYIECLKKDPTCLEAFNRLIDCFMLNRMEKENLIKELDFGPEDEWIKQYYIERINENVSIVNERKLDDTDNEDTASINTTNIYQTLLEKNNVDILSIQAKNAFSKYDILQAYEICQKTIKNGQLSFQILPVYYACLLDLGYVGEMYYHTHALVENYPNHALSWFAIATYYFLIKKYENSRKHYQKSLNIDKSIPYSWTGLAHSFAIQDQSDQAMSLYRTASRLFPGSHTSHLYMGMEYLRLNNKTAIYALQSAHQINPTDPLVLNQMGSFYYKIKDYKQAKEYFSRAISRAEGAIGWIVETIMGNLAHCYRKMKKYSEAIQLLQKCIHINPSNPHTLFSLGFVHHMSFEINTAIAYYHKSLKIKPDNQFAVEMLSKAMGDVVWGECEVFKNV